MKRTYVVGVLDPSGSRREVRMVPVAGLDAAKQIAVWGTYGKGGVEHCHGTCPEHQLVWKRLVDCDTEHLQAIARTQYQLVSTDYPKIIAAILADRGVKCAA